MFGTRKKTRFIGSVIESAKSPLPDGLTSRRGGTNRNVGCSDEVGEIRQNRRPTGNNREVNQRLIDASGR